MEERKEEKKDIKIVSGDGKDLNISPVYNHIPISKPKIDKTGQEKIVIPKEKKKN